MKKKLGKLLPFQNSQKFVKYAFDNLGNKVSKPKLLCLINFREFSGVRKISSILAHKEMQNSSTDEFADYRGFFVIR